MYNTNNQAICANGCEVVGQENKKIIGNEYLFESYENERRKGNE